VIDDVKTDPGSYRDPNGYIVHFEGRVLRILSQNGFNNWKAFSTSPLISQLHEKELLIPTVEPSDSTSLAQHFNAASVLEHLPIPTLNYPYEWPFSLLKEAALVHLEIIINSLNSGFTLQDGTPFNTQWVNGKVVFIDVGSFEKHIDGQPWLALGQFCETMLYPLMLWSYKDFPAPILLRGSLNGIEISQCANLFNFKDWLRRGVFWHIFVRSLLERQIKKSSYDSVHRKASNLQVKSKNVIGIIQGIQGVVNSLKGPKLSQWANYANERCYSQKEFLEKKVFIENIVSKKSYNTIWDIGTNNAEMAIMASNYSEQVVAMDSDASVMEMAVKRIKKLSIKNITPQLINFSDPSPSLGWRLTERPSLFDRKRPDLIFALAIIHHLRISDNIPLSNIISWFACLAPSLIIEFVDRKDPMVKQLISLKKDIYIDYTEDLFRKCLGDNYSIVEEYRISESRLLFFCESP